MLWPVITLMWAIATISDCQMQPPKYNPESTSSVPHEYATDPYAKPAQPPGHPGDAYDSDCKYEDVPFTDCDPFHLVKWRQMKLIFGPNHCQSYKNETERCSTSDFPPGTYLVQRPKAKGQQQK